MGSEKTVLYASKLNPSGLSSRPVCWVSRLLLLKEAKATYSMGYRQTMAMAASRR